MFKLNKVYHIDNLELMEQINDSSIDLIYSDILFNTGRKFKDFNDNLGTPEEAVEWYRPRLIEMKRILKTNGNIVLHCDWHFSHYLKVLMDEVFGINSFRNEIIWRYKRWTGKSDNKLQSMHDNLLFYSKGNNKKGENTMNHQFEKIEQPRMYQNRKDKNGDVIRNEDGSVKYFPQTERQIDDVWEISFLNPRAKERVGYDTQKPEELTDRIIKMFSNEGDVVADFFCGSGTTLVSAKKLNRNYIGCDINEKAIHITEDRLNKAI